MIMLPPLTRDDVKRYDKIFLRISQDVATECKDDFALVAYD